MVQIRSHLPFNILTIMQFAASFLPTELLTLLKQNPIAAFLFSGLTIWVINLCKAVPKQIWSFVSDHLFYRIYVTQECEAYWLLMKLFDDRRILPNYRSFSVENIEAGAGMWAFSSKFRKMKEDSDKNNSLVPGKGSTWFNYKGVLFHLRKNIIISEKQEKKMELFLTAYTLNKEKALRIYSDAIEQLDNSFSFKVHTYVEGRWSEVADPQVRPINTIIQPPGVIEGFMKDLETFFADKANYLRTGQPYRRGYFIHGLWGVGKTSIVSAVAAYYQKNLYVTQLSYFSTGQSLLNALHQTPTGAIILFDDIRPSMFTARSGIGQEYKKRSDNQSDADVPETKNISTTKPSATKELTALLKTSKEDSSAGYELPLQELLFALDGPLTPTDRILVFTSNACEGFDPAFMRPGRVDKKIQFYHLAKPEQKRMSLIWYEKEIEGVDAEVAPCDLKEIFQECPTPQQAQMRLLQHIQNKPQS